MKYQVLDFIIKYGQIAGDLSNKIEIRINFIQSAQNQRNSVSKQPFLTFNSTKEPFAGTLRPSTQDKISSPIWSGLAQVEKSALGMPALFDSVSIMLGRIVTTLPSNYLALYAKAVAM